MVIKEQSTRDESRGSLLGEIRPDLPPDTATNPQDEVTTSNAALQNTNSSELVIPREEFTLIEDHESLEEIVIYDMVVEYQGIVHYDGDIIEIKEGVTERSPSKDIVEDIPQSQTVKSNSITDILELTTMSRVIISHEEEVLAQSCGETSDEDLDECTKILNNKADDEQWGGTESTKKT